MEVNIACEHQTETTDPSERTAIRERAAAHGARAANSLSAAQQANAAALIALGLAEKVAHRLAGRYSQARIAEKLEYLTFLQADQPEKVHNPRGWLRRAIEENYGPPDGFIATAEREQMAAVQARSEQEELVRAQAAEVARQQAQAQKAAQLQAYRAWLTQIYGTTSSDFAFWEQALPELELAFCLHRDIFQHYIEPAEMLKVTDEEVRLGFKNEYLAKHLTHPGTKKRIERTLSAVAGRTVQVCYEVIDAAELVTRS